jgi:Rrf2 family protein
MAFLAARGGVRASTREIAGAMGASVAHLAKVLRSLDRAGLLRAVRGPAGGFRLARPARTITLREIYEAIEGPLKTTRCIFGEDLCHAACTLAGLFRRADRLIVEGLARTRLSDFRPDFKVLEKRLRAEAS